MKNLLNKTVTIKPSPFAKLNEYSNLQSIIIEEYLSTEDIPAYDIKVEFPNGITELFDLGEVIMLGDDIFA